MKRRIVYKTGKWIILIFGIIISFFVLKGVMTTLRFMRITGISPDLVWRLVFDDGVSLQSYDGRTNILLLGVGGGAHDGADLTDTMMVISIGSENAAALTALLSIPRDIWSDTLKDKVNSAYHYGEEKKEGGGMLLARVVAEDVVGVPIHYSMIIDFSGFKKIIDEIGGIDVQVSSAFTDNDFPIEGKENDSCPGDPLNRCVYETIHFNAGLQHMDGTTALKYARSRHAEGDEGGDFARSRRQQEIIVALKNTFIHPQKWFSMERAGTLQRVVDETIDSDMNIAELVTVAKRFLLRKDAEMKKISIDDLLYNPPAYIYGRYVLIPNENWAAVHTFVKQQLGLE